MSTPEAKIAHFQFFLFYCEKWVILIYIVAFNLLFEGMSGDVILDNMGDREPDFWVMDMDPITGKFEKVTELVNFISGVKVSKTYPLYFVFELLKIGNDKTNAYISFC